MRCELPGCGGLLLSHSRGPARRWCTMETCGNIAKVAAHRARARAGR
ncbi:MAG: CGNR zinc finger domain-containing protein [Candidatus Elarobacter sp.]